VARPTIKVGDVKKDIPSNAAVFYLKVMLFDGIEGKEARRKVDELETRLPVSTKTDAVRMFRDAAHQATKTVNHERSRADLPSDIIHFLQIVANQPARSVDLDALVFGDIVPEARHLLEAYGIET